MKKFPLALGTSALALALALTGCSAANGDGSNPPSTSESSTVAANTADETFVTMMIPHHQQAVEMADIVLAKEGVNPRVIDLAQQVKEAQGPEIERMLTWLDDWGVEYDPNGGSMDGMDHGSMDESGDGMMTADDMSALENADGVGASRLFLEQMIVHHVGAVDMARAALEDGQHPDVLELAQQVVDDQTAEISVMEDLLTQL
ncbi:DUF305 domain-containing protein [Leucobacter sp. W1478]|uniref:DUF305 domain-containing protein n=1 Tax=Leucobacter sp. W1478 TaxID=3439065 RepID=UPI003F2C27D8